MAARQTSGFSWSGPVRILVDVDVHRFAVGVYGLPANRGGVKGVELRQCAVVRGDWCDVRSDW